MGQAPACQPPERRPQPDPQSILIIGYGSSLRSDDAAGPIAARLLAGNGWRALALHQLTPELAETIAHSELVIFLDAALDVQPGEIHAHPLEPAPQAARALEHHVTPAGLLRLARDLYGAAPAAWLIGMGVADFSLGESISPAARRAIEQAVAYVKSQMPELSKPGSQR